MNKYLTARSVWTLSIVTAFGLAAGPKDAQAQTVSFTVQPLATIAGQLLGQNQQGTKTVAVQVLDSNGLLPLPNTSVTLTLSNPNGAALAGTVTRTTNVLGIAVFNDLDVVKAGTGYILKAVVGTATGLSNPFTILPGTPSAVSAPQTPATAIAGQSMSPVTVKALDSYGNAVPSTSITMSLGNGSGATLGGTLTKSTDSTGTATFSDLKIAKAKAGYTLGATTNGVTANSPAFTVTAGPLAAVAFSQQPAAAVAGQALSAVTVLATDANGNVVPGASVALSLNNGGNGASLNSSAPVTTDATGLATFSGLSVSQAGTGYTLAANSGSFSAVSNAFSVAAALTWSAVSNSTGADGYTRVLWNRSDGLAAVWKVDTQGNVATQQQFGPYAGWTAKTIATGPDNRTRMLWTNTNGTAAYYLLAADNTFLGQQQYGPYAGWTPSSLAVEPDNTLRALWTNTDGTATVWTMDATNLRLSQRQYGPYTGWTAKSLTANPDGSERLLWAHTNGTAAFWRLNSGSQLLDQKQYGPYTGWAPTSIAAASDGTARAIWVNTDSTIAMWTLDASNTYTGQVQLGGASSGWFFRNISLGSDGNARLLFVNLAGQLLLSNMTPAGSVVRNTQYGPY